jgi:hypothetical protein
VSKTPLILKMIANNRGLRYNVGRHYKRRSAHRLPYHRLRSNHGIMSADIISAGVRIDYHTIDCAAIMV